MLVVANVRDRHDLHFSVLLATIGRSDTIGFTGKERKSLNRVMLIFRLSLPGTPIRGLGVRAVVKIAKKNTKNFPFLLPSSSEKSTKEQP